MTLKTHDFRPVPAFCAAQHRQATDMLCLAYFGARRHVKRVSSGMPLLASRTRLMARRCVACVDLVYWPGL
jgi:hypothetical protein